MGVTLGTLRRFEEAINSFKRALEIDPENDDAWNNKGTAFFNLSRYPEALESFNKALKINPENYSAWAGKGSVLRFLEDYKEAVRCLEKFIEVNAGNPSPQIEEAWAMILELKILIQNEKSEKKLENRHKKTDDL
ncbi:MAG: lipoprotein NlpI [Methanobacterium sp. PtaU1.Bin242]|nr:MAG: lipoprotein NlpI [Methanobacterium sp. PtaU1.Bin242]